MYQARRPSFRATSATVPDPPKGSSTTHGSRSSVPHRNHRLPDDRLQPVIPQTEVGWAGHDSLHRAFGQIAQHVEDVTDVKIHWRVFGHLIVSNFWAWQ